MRRKEEQAEQLEALDPGYWEEDFDAAGAELAALPAHFDEAVLEAELESRSWCLEVRPSPSPLPRGAREAAMGLHRALPGRQCDVTLWLTANVRRKDEGL